MSNLPVQHDRKNTEGFPSYIVRRDGSTAALQSYGPSGWDHYRALLDTRPWDEMWRTRATRLYLLDPRLLTPAGEEWLERLVGFMYAYRQALWERCHWLHTGKQENISVAGWIPWVRRRALLSQHLDTAWGALMKLAPAEMTPYLPLVQGEPALWTCPLWHCTWMPDTSALCASPPAYVSLARQLETLDDEEPIRHQWAGPHKSRFIEALTPRCQRALALHHTIGISWEFPAPWNDPTFTPTPLTERYLGTPGPDFGELSSAAITDWNNRVKACKSTALLITSTNHIPVARDLLPLLLNPWHGANVSAVSDLPREESKSGDAEDAEVTSDVEDDDASNSDSLDEAEAGEDDDGDSVDDDSVMAADDDEH